MTSAEVRPLRELLQLTHAAFARVTGVDVRTVYRWEAGRVEPAGASREVLVAFKRQAEMSPESLRALREVLVVAADFGGLSYLILVLLDRAVPRTGVRP